MRYPFHDAGVKLKWANQHIANLDAAIRELSRNSKHTVVINRHPDGVCDTFHVESTSTVPDDILLIVGDALNNMRSSLDYALYSITNADKFSKFPIRKTRQELIAAINGGLKEKATSNIVHLIGEVIQPYEGGDGDFLWQLNDLNNIDKHELLIAKTRLDIVRNIRAEDESGAEINMPDWLIVEGRTPPPTLLIGHRNVKITNNGDAACIVVFGEGMPLAGRPILPVLRAISIKVNQTIGLLNFTWSRQIAQQQTG